MFGKRQPISIPSLTQDSVRGAVLHASTLAVFLLGVVSQGFSPCPHHAGLDPSGPVHGAVSTGAMPGGMHHGASAPADQEPEDAEAVCSCLEGCGTQSGESLPSGQFHPRRAVSTALHVVERLDTSPLDTRQNAYLVPLSQPPPNSPGRSS